MSFHAIAANKSPAVFQDPKVPSRERIIELGTEVGATMAEVAITQAIRETFDLLRVLQVVYERDAAECDIDEALYDGFHSH